MSIDKIIADKKKKKESLLIRADKTNDINELRLINDQLRDINNEITDLNNLLSEGEHFVPGGEKRGLNNQDTFNPIATFKMGSKQNNNTNDPAPFKKGDIFGNLASRSNMIFDNVQKTENQHQEGETRSLDLGKYVKGVVTGDWTDAEVEKRSMMTSAVGVIIPQVLSSQIINISRDLSLFASSDVPIIPMASNNLTIARIKNSPTFKFKKEGEKASESGFELEPVKLEAKTAYGYAYVSLEAIRSSANLGNILTNVFSQAIADCIDKGMLYGQYNDSSSSYDTFAPKGILNDETINTIAASEKVSYDDFIKAVGKIKSKNGEPKFYGINTYTEEQMSLLKASDGTYLEPPKAIQNMKPIVTNQLIHNEVSGSDAIVFDPNAMVIGIQDNINIKMFDNTDYCIENGMIGFRVYAMIDCVVTMPKHICKITGVK